MKQYLILVVSHEHGCTCSSLISLEGRLLDNELGKAYNAAIDLLGEPPDEVFLIHDNKVIKHFVNECWNKS